MLYNLFYLLYLCLLIVSCANPQQSKKKLIVTGLKPIASIIEYITEDMFIIESIIPMNIDPHQYNLKPSDVMKINDASLILVLDKHLDGGLVLNNQHTNNVFILNDIDENHNHNSNPHLWTSFLHSIELVNRITDILSIQYPDKKDIFIKRQQSYIEQINKKYQEIYNLSKSNNRKLYVVQRHHVWDFLLEELDVKLIGTLEDHENEQPSLHKIIGLIQKIKKYPIDNVFLIDDAFSPPSMALQRISKETGAKIVIFNPMQSIDGSSKHLEILSTYGILLSQ